MEEASLMQHEALQEVGLTPSPHNLALLRATALKHPELALYVRNNVSREGHLQSNDVAPEVHLRTIENKSFQWPPKDMKAGVPLVVISGSTS